MRRRLVLALMAAAAAAPGLAFASEVRSSALKDELHFLDLYLSLPPAARSHFYLAYRAERGARPAPDARAIIVAPDGVRTPLPLDRAGEVLRLPTLAQLHSDRLEMDGPPFSFQLEMRAAVPCANRVDPTALSMALAQLNAGIAHSGSLAFLAPRMTAAFFVDSGAGRALTSDGHALPLPTCTAPGVGRVPYFTPASMQGVTAVQLARPPSRILLGAPGPLTALAARA